MRQSRVRRQIYLGAPLLVAAALAMPISSLAARTQKPARPLVSTGGVGDVRGTSAQLDGLVDPRGAATTYYFEYGPTITYGTNSATATLAPAFAKVKVGVTVTGLTVGYHYRLVASNSFGTIDGKDRIYGVSAKRRFVLPTNPSPTVYGEAFAVSGTMTGTDSANRELVLQSSPYPYRTPFVDVTAPAPTSALGRFAFRVEQLTENTEFRVATVEPRPVYSQILDEHVGVRVTLKVSAKGPKGLVRLYGTVTPAEVGAPLMIQFRVPVRAGRKSEATTRFANQFSATVRRGTKTVSRFSTVVLIRHQGRYRAFVEVRRGALSSGASASVVLSAAPAKKKAHHKSKASGKA